MSERDDLIEALGKQRFFLRHTVQGLTDDQDEHVHGSSGWDS